MIPFKASYDAWGNQTLITETLFFRRGYTGHEMLPEYGLINMNGRLYDPQLGRFLSPDNYVQMPDFSQSFNRYSYCINNPLKFTDPDGEWFWLIPLIGGAINLTAHLITGDVKNFAHGLSLFGVGTLGTLASFANPSFGAAVIGAGNSFVNQGFTKGWNNIDYMQVGSSAFYGIATSYVGAKLNLAFSRPINNLTSNIASPVVRGAVTNGITNAAGGFTISAGLTLINGGSSKDIWQQGWQGAWTGFTFGSINGAVEGFNYARENHVSPWTGKGCINGYDHRLDVQSDLFHDFPRLLDNTIVDSRHLYGTIENSSMYCAPGNINETNGIFTIGINNNTGVIYHRQFIPERKINKFYFK